MFNLTLLDHLRLTFGHVVSRHRAHSHIAHTRAQASRRLRAVEALLLAIVAFTAIGAITQPDTPWINRPTFQQAVEVGK